ncbi:hypothetical protein F3D3_3126 [Fusibacter sp. 3D3]|nr:hypothetical protein F3D3_3126 [Fusibacter sp. 3D3]
MDETAYHYLESSIVTGRMKRYFAQIGARDWIFVRELKAFAGE